LAGTTPVLSVRSSLFVLCSYCFEYIIRLQGVLSLAKPILILVTNKKINMFSGFLGRFLLMIVCSKLTLFFLMFLQTDCNLKHHDLIKS